MNAHVQQHAGLTGLEQLRALMNEGRRPGIGVSLDFKLVDVAAGLAVFEGVPGEQLLDNNEASYTVNFG